MGKASHYPLSVRLYGNIYRKLAGPNCIPRNGFARKRTGVNVSIIDAIQMRRRRVAIRQDWWRKGRILGPQPR